MPTAWLPKPLYKQVRYTSIMLLAILFLLGFSTPLFWTVAAVYLLLWGGLTAVVAYRIESGFFITTLNRFQDIGNKVCITFDDGPCEQTGEILDKLKHSKAGASFFCIGERLGRHPELARRIIDEGHTIGNHSFSHRLSFPISGAAAIEKEISATQALIARLTGTTPRFFRPPFGVTNPLVAAALERTGLLTLGWSVRTHDTVNMDHKKIVSKIKREIYPGSIILLHDTTEGAVQLLEEVLRICASKGLQPVSLDEAYAGCDEEGQGRAARGSSMASCSGKKRVSR